MLGGGERAERSLDYHPQADDFPHIRRALAEKEYVTGDCGACVQVCK